MDIFAEGFDKIKSLKDRELERQLNLQKKQELKSSILAENEQMDYFEKSFMEKQYAIEALLGRVHQVPKQDLAEYFNNINKDILILQKYVAASNLFLRSYYIKRCQNIVQDLSDKARDLENVFLPKKKFGFKNKTKAKVQETKVNGYDTVDFSAKKVIQFQDCGFSDKSNETLSLGGEIISKKDIILENLTGCRVTLQGDPSTLFLNRLKNCHVFCGPVSTSIFAEDCENCTFVIACQQLRLHASRHIDIYLHVTSRAIMEDCFAICFAPYNWRYQNIEADFKKAGLDVSVNNWKCIDDFNWLNVEKRSPNWSEIEEAKKITEWT